MNKINMILATVTLSSLTIACSDEAKYKVMEDKYKAVQVEKKRHESMTHEQMVAHQLADDGHSSASQAHMKGNDIGRRADDLPPPITRTEAQLVKVDLYTDELVAEMMPEVTYQYWTYNGKVPAPFIRVREGDTVEIHLRHGNPNGKEQVHSEHTATQHAAAGHSAHSIDLHAVVGAGGGAPLMQVGQGEEKSFQFKATRAGIYVYHCASPHVPSHIANGMYGMILVEPVNGLAKVDREFYVMQGEFYTSGKYGEKGLQDLSKEKLLAEQPEYFLFNGRVNSLSADRALKAKVGEKIRLFVGVGSHIASNFHIIGAVFDNLYSQGAITNPPLKNVQTTVIAAGSAVMIEFTVDVAGKYLLVDHSLSRAIDKGALAELIIEDK
jgi:nitrite reductase (NO-forming)